MPGKRIVPLIVAVALFMENMDSTVTISGTMRLPGMENDRIRIVASQL